MRLYVDPANENVLDGIVSPDNERKMKINFN